MAGGTILGNKIFRKYFPVRANFMVSNVPEFYYSLVDIEVNCCPIKWYPLVIVLIGCAFHVILDDFVILLRMFQVLPDMRLNQIYKF